MTGERGLSRRPSPGVVRGVAEPRLLDDGVHVQESDGGLERHVAELLTEGYPLLGMSRRMRSMLRAVCIDVSGRVLVDQDLDAERRTAFASVAFVVSRSVVAVVRVLEVGGACLAPAERACDLQKGVMVFHDH